MCLRTNDPKTCRGHRCVACGEKFFCGGARHECPPRPTNGYDLGQPIEMSVGERLDYAAELNRGNE